LTASPAIKVFIDPLIELIKGALSAGPELLEVRRPKHPIALICGGGDSAEAERHDPRNLT
jgi:hypothetical protein